MAVTAMAGTVGWAPQNTKSTDTSYSAPSSYYRHKATAVDLAVLDDVRLGAPEIGGVPVPTFPYKAGVVVGGGMTIQPRLEDVIGWLLHGMMGYVTSSQQGTTAVYDHLFQFTTTDASDVKWMSFRKAIPRKDNVATTDVGETFTDCKIVGMTMNLANDAPITSRIDVLGRTFELDDDPTAWTWTNSFESFASIPVGCITGGYLKLTDYSATELPIVAASVTFQNIPLDIRQERVFGSPYLEDITIIMRQLSFDMIVKWSDPELYRAVLTGSTTGTEWSQGVYTSALEIMVQSPNNIPTKSVPYSLVINAPSVMVSAAEGITLAGNQAITMRFTGTAVEDPGNSYATFKLTNLDTQYSWPT